MKNVKILWVCNVPIPKVANAIGMKVPNICGWLTGFANELEKEKNIELSICFPQLGIKEMKSGEIGRIHYYAFSQPQVLGFLPAEDQINISTKMEKHINNIIALVKPDILHIFGTEYPHSLIAAKEFNNPSKTIVNIQGLTSFYWMHYTAGIPYEEIKRFTISNIVRGNMLQQRNKLKKRGDFEIEILQNVEHVIGRTDWDEACVKQINPSVHYHYCNESLRDSFYNGQWSYEQCEKNSIFMSQASTPIKGLQFMLQALPEILKKFPDTHLYIAGKDLTKSDTIYEKIKISSFGKYIRKIINENNLLNSVTFTGPLTEKQIKNRFLKSNVFVCPSTIENSPNSLGEAMLLAVPCISADVGGVKNLMLHNAEGFIYQSDAPYMLAYYVMKVFSEQAHAINMGVEAQKHAKKIHDRKINLSQLLDVYEEVINDR